MRDLSIEGRLQVHIAKDFEELSAALANFFSAELGRIAGKKNVIVPGGSTPGLFFNHSAELIKEWEGITIILSDERLVDVEDSNSNYKLVKSQLIESVIGEKPGLLGVFQKGLTTDEIQASVENRLSKVLEGGKLISVLGFGTDAHTASLFPYNEENLNLEKSTLIFQKEGDDFFRMSLGYKILLGSEILIFLLKGKDKAEPLLNALKGDYDPLLYPSQYLFKNFQGDIHIFCDEDAASLL